MLEKIKSWLRKTPVDVPKDVYYKIDVLKKANISLYSPPYSYLTLSVLEKDIGLYTERLKYIVNYKQDDELIDIQDITINSYAPVRLAEWCSINGKLIENDVAYFNQWLDLCKLLQERYVLISNSKYEKTRYYNNYKTQPYVINTSSIIDQLYEQL